MVSVLASLLLAAAIAPPVIHEPFTPLPCPIHPDTTVDVEGCQERRILRTDRQIDGAVRTVFRLLRTRRARLSFVDGERSWLHYRRSSCTAEAATRYAGGSAEPVAYLSCTLRKNRAHLVELAATRKALAQR
ncbi:MAG TPA: lysozyme inhibitor LprI family protein [Gaiellaceae bacterium]|jgi:uncharacterized protein YecT (DUF1311 family)|nr:lysozyme inhibitor LprI family protein [Gaiellaceae bacterium]